MILSIPAGIRGANVRREAIMSAVNDYVDPHARQYVAATFGGDPRAAFYLIIAAPNDKRGELALWCWRAKIPVAAFREVLLSVWNHDHEYLISAAGGRRTLRAMFNYANFPVAGLPPVLTAYRGTSAVSQRLAAKGLAWTLDRRVACWFAMRSRAKDMAPLVLKTTVAREQVALHTNERKEREVVLFDVVDAVTDGDPSIWQLEFQAWERRLQRQRKAQLRRARVKWQEARQL
jgi:hypothetical protein